MMKTSVQRSAAGFSLIELLVVLAIVTAVSAIAVPALMRPSDRVALSRTATEMAGALRLTRSLAILRNQETAFMLDLEANHYRFGIAEERDLPANIEAAFTVADVERRSTHLGGIRFFPDGSSTGGEIRLSAGEQQIQLCIHWLTGEPSRAEKC